MSYNAVWEVVKFQNEMDANFSMSSLSDEEVLKFQLCVDQCIHLMTSSSGPGRGGSNNSFIVSWCNQSSQIWFHELYYELWRRSSAINSLLHIIQPYCVPAFLAWSMLQMAVLSLVLILSSELTKANPFWLFLLAYCLLAELKMLVASLLFSIVGKQFPKNNLVCRSQQFLTSTLSTVPNWILAETLFNETLRCVHCASLPAVGVIGTKIIILSSLISVVILNAHSLWLYSVDPVEKACNIHTQSEPNVLVIGYPIYLEIIENLIPGTIIIISVAILSYCHFKPSRRRDHHTQTSICLGINFLLFNFPSAIYWFMTTFMKPNSSLKTFNNLKMNTFFVVISNILAEQSFSFILLILFLTSSSFRKTTYSHLERIYKRVHKSRTSKHGTIAKADKDLKEHSETIVPLVKIDNCK